MLIQIMSKSQAILLGNNHLRLPESGLSGSDSDATGWLRGQRAFDTTLRNYGHNLSEQRQALRQRWSALSAVW